MEISDKLQKQIEESRELIKNLVTSKILEEAKISLDFEIEQLFFNIEKSVSNMKRVGMSKKAVKEVLFNDFQEGGRIFGGFKNSLKQTVVKSVGDTAQETYENKILKWNKATKSFEEPDINFIDNVFGRNRLDRKSTIWQDDIYIYEYKNGKITKTKIEDEQKPDYQWITVRDQKVCRDCKPRHGLVKSMKDWTLIGKPKTGWSVCRNRCRCLLELSSAVPPGIKEFIRKKI